MHERIYDEFLEKAKEAALKRVVGDPFKKGVEQGPQVLSLLWHSIIWADLCSIKEIKGFMYDCSNNFKNY